MSQALASDSTYSEIAFKITCHEQPATEALADVLRTLVEPLRHAQNDLYGNNGCPWPSDKLSVACGKDGIREGSLCRDFAGLGHVNGRFVSPASSPLNLEIRENGTVLLRESRAQNEESRDEDDDDNEAAANDGDE